MNKPKTITGAILTTLGITTATLSITGNTIFSNPTSPKNILSIALFIAGTFILRTGLEGITITSEVKNNPSILRIAQKLPDKTGKEINHLIKELKKGNTNPGIGTKAIDEKTRELRGANGARVYYQQKSPKKYSILGYSDKKTQDKVISYIKKSYNA